MKKGDRLSNGSYILEIEAGFAMAMNRNYFITGRVEGDSLIDSKAFTDRAAALQDMRRRARVSKIIGEQAGRE